MQKYEILGKMLIYTDIVGNKISEVYGNRYADYPSPLYQSFSYEGEVKLVFTSVLRHENEQSSSFKYLKLTS